MAQVKKLQTGGKFRMNGRELQGQTAIDRLSAVYSNSPVGEREMFNVAQSAILDGNTAQYDPTNNTIIVFDKDNNDITSKYTDTKANVNNSALKKLGESLFQTRDWRFKKSGERMSLVDMSDPNNSVSDNSNKTKLRRGSEFFEYDEDPENGTRTLRSNQYNADRLKILRDIESFYKDTLDNQKNNYNLDEWTNYNRDIEAFRNYYTGLENDEARNVYFNNLIDRIKSGNLSQADLDILKGFGFEKENKSSAEGSDNGAGANVPMIHKDWTGDRDAAKRAGLSISKTPDGHWKISGNDLYTNNNWYTSGLDWVPQEYDRGFIINGILYNENEAYNSEALRPFVSGWYGARRNNGWKSYYDDLNNSHIRFVNDRIWNNALDESHADYNGLFGFRFDPSQQYQEILTPYLKRQKINGPIDVADITGNFENMGNRRVFAYVDPSWKGIGMPSVNYIVYDPDNTENPYTNVTEGFTPSRFPSRGEIKTSTWENIDGKRYGEYRTVNFKGEQNSILYGEDGNLYYARRDRSGSLVKPILIKNMTLLRQILANPDDQSLNNKTWEALGKNSDATSVNGDVENAPFTDRELKRIANETQSIAAELISAGYGQREAYALAEENAKKDAIARRNRRSGKHQFGGVLKNTLSSNSDVTETKDAKADISKAHALDGSDGGLTDWEKEQIYASIGDLAGVAASFIPSVAGGVAGTGIGLASSITRLHADAKRDGLDAGDWKRFAVNALFDLGSLPASLIPGADNALRASKFIKSAKSLGGTLIKWLGTIGATTSTINIGQKIISGDKVTSQDLARFISGIPAGVLAGRQWAKTVGSAKLASRQSKSQVASLEKELNAVQNVKMKPKGSENDINIELSKNDIHRIITDAGGKQNIVLSKVKNLVETKTGAKLSDEEAKNLLSKFGAQTDVKGKVSLKLFKDHKLANPFKRDTQVTQDVGNTEERSALYYIRHPFKRQRALGLMKANGRQANLLSNMSEQEYRTLINESRRLGSESRALAEAAMWNPNQFGFALPNTIAVPGRILGWEGTLARYHKRMPNEMLALPPHPKKVYHRPRILRNQWEKGVETPDVIYSQPNLPIVYGGTSHARVPKRFWLGPRTDSNSEIVVDPNTTFRRLYEPGHYSGRRAIRINPNSPLIEDAVLITPAPYMRPSVEFIPTTLFKEGGKINKEQNGGTVGGDWFTQKTLNLPNIDDSVRLLLTLKNINKKRDINKKGYDILRSKTFSVSEDPYIDYNTSLIERKYDKSKKPIEQSEYETNDSNRKLAFNLSKSDRLSELEKDKNAEISSNITETDNVNRVTSSKNAAARTDAANKRMDYLTQLDFQKNAADAIALAERHQAIETFGQQMSQAGRDAFNNMLSTQYSVEKRKLDEAENLRINGALRGKGYLDKWNSLSAQDQSRFGDIKDYVYSINQEDYKNIFGNSAKYLNDISELTKRYARAYGPSMYFKRGGKNSVRSAQDQIAINSIKQAQRATAKLSDNLMKLLQNLLSK